MGEFLTMTIPKTVGLAVLLSILTSSVAVAQSPVVAQWKTYVLESCGKEIKRSCKGVVAGDGRLLACLYSREKSLSAGCKTAVAAARDRLAKSYAALADAQRVCEPDAKRLCNGVVAGDGNLTDCLARARARVSRACNAVLDEALMRP
jgi:superfamily II DNA/RNA helicase